MTASTPTPETSETEGLTEVTLNLVALGAAVAANAERAFRAHQVRLEELGVPKNEMIQVVNMALRVKNDPHQIMMTLAESALTEGGGGCCGGCACEEGGGEKGDCGDDCDCR